MSEANTNTPGSGNSPVPTPEQEQASMMKEDDKKDLKDKKTSKPKFFIKMGQFQAMLAQLGLQAHMTYKDKLQDMAKEVLDNIVQSIADKIKNEKLTTVDRDAVPFSDDEQQQAIFSVSPFRTTLKNAVKNAVGYGPEQKIRWQETAIQKAEKAFQYKLVQVFKKIPQEGLKKKGAFKLLSTIPYTPAPKRKRGNNSNSDKDSSDEHSEKEKKRKVEQPQEHDTKEKETKEPLPQSQSPSTPSTPQASSPPSSPLIKTKKEVRSRARGGRSKQAKELRLQSGTLHNCNQSIPLVSEVPCTA